MNKKLKVGLLCGGPSLERGISLNSARSVLDHLEDENIEVVPFYFDPTRKPYKVSKAQLYSNTPSDFDFKLKSEASPLTEQTLIKELKKCDIAFPAMHGLMGEDGEIQKFFEKNKIPFIASPSSACELVYNKFNTNELLSEKGFFTLPSILLRKDDKNNKKNIENFFRIHSLKRAIVKPATGGSSIGVFSVDSINEAVTKMEYIFNSQMDSSVVIEPFARGRECTIIVLQNKKGKPVALVPTEIEMSYAGGAVFDYRKKYLPTHGTMYHNPARFTDTQIKKIQKQAEAIFVLFGMRDFARLDAWVLDDGNIWFSDINPVSGMEQNSFLFQQGARIGLSHQDLLHYIVTNACARYGIKIPKNKKVNQKRKVVNVLFGGPSSERQVSLMSGTNIWLKLRKSKIYEPKPFVLDFDLNIWELPYSFVLNHTVEEILYTAKNAKSILGKLEPLLKNIHQELGLKKSDIKEPFFLPRKYTLKEFIKKSKFVFMGLHGSPGEDGILQALFEKKNVKYNGSNSKVSAICMDKFVTGQMINNMHIPEIHSAYQKVVKVKEIKDYRNFFAKLLKELKAKTIIVKPRADGCSSGIFRLFDARDLEKYVGFVRKGAHFVPAGTFKNQKDIVDMPTSVVSELLFENFIETDTIKIDGIKLKYMKKTGWVEVTVGVYTYHPAFGTPPKIGGDEIRVMNPSITVSEGEVLSVEEKFQGGTGVNITPPPASIIKPAILKKIKERIGLVASGVGIEGYARIDAFVKTDTGEVNVIEINNLPGLTPSTVIYHQALAELTPMFPTTFLEQLIKNKGY